MAFAPGRDTMIRRSSFVAAALLLAAAVGCFKTSSVTKPKPPEDKPPAPTTVEGRVVSLNEKTLVLTLESGDDTEDREIQTTKDTQWLSDVGQEVKNNINHAFATGPVVVELGKQDGKEVAVKVRGGGSLGPYRRPMGKFESYDSQNNKIVISDEGTKKTYPCKPQLEVSGVAGIQAPKPTDPRFNEFFQGVSVQLTVGRSTGKKCVENVHVMNPDELSKKGPAKDTTTKDQNPKDTRPKDRRKKKDS